MRSKQPMTSSQGIKTIHSAGIRSIPQAQRSSYLDLYTLGREKGRLEKELFALDKRRTAGVRQLDNVIKRIIRLQKETSEEGRAKTPKGMHSVHVKPLKTMAIQY